MKKKVLFLIHDLGQGGAEKVLVNLVNHMNQEVFNITVMTLFGGGVNEQFLRKEIRLKSVFKRSIPGNTIWMKLFSPQILHSLFIREKYDIEISYLEGPSARVISGCKDNSTKLVSWIHIEQHTLERLSKWFRSKKEALNSYARFDKTICVSKTVQKDFCSITDYRGSCEVLFNTVESDNIIKLAQEKQNKILDDGAIRLIAVGSLKESKGYDRLLRIIKRLKENNINAHLYILGIGPLKEQLEQYIIQNNLDKMISLLGYDTNPYKYVAKCDLFVCASHREGFSTAATEAIILGVPVCTVEVSGMKELLGENNEYGFVTENSEDALYRGMKELIDDPSLLSYYKEQSKKRSVFFNTESTVKSVEDMLLNL